MVPIDYTRFLSKTERSILPYLGGSTVFAPDRRLRVTRRVGEGWWAFDLEGRHATPVQRVEYPDRSALERVPRTHGHVIDTWLFVGGAQAHRLHLCPEEELPHFSPVSARRWYGGNHLYDEQQFEDEPEMAVREAFVQRTENLGGLEIRGTTPSLKAAFGYATLLRAADERNIPLALSEVLDRAHDVASGRMSASLVIDQLEARRYRQDPIGLYSWQLARAESASRRRGGRASRDDAEERAARVLEKAEADLLAVRFLDDPCMEVRFRYCGEHFVAVVDWGTLHVYDAGICLDGADEQLGLDALPVVIREAMRNGELVVLRR